MRLKTIDGFFHLKENNTKISTEIIAGLSIFFTMAYIIVVNPKVLSEAGIEWSAVFVATILISAISCLLIGIFANVPFALAPGLGLNTFFTYVMCASFGLTWQQALSVVFICGIINIIITVSSLRKKIIKAIPNVIKAAIGGGIGLFVAYVGILNAGLISFSDGVPELVPFNTAGTILFLVGLIVTIALMVLKIKGAIIIGIIITSLIGIPLGLTNLADSINFIEAFSSLPSTFGVIFTSAGLPSLFSSPSVIIVFLLSIFSLTISDFFDSVGTFVGVGKSTGIFTAKDLENMETKPGFKTKLDKALVIDSVSTSIGAVIGTSNVTTYAESSVGIESGGRTGLTSVVVAMCFVACLFLSSIVSMVPIQAAAPALVVVGIVMISSFADINWRDFSEAIPAFFTGIFMALCYNITYGIAAGFITYSVVKICRREFKELSPLFIVVTLLFLMNFIFAAIAF